MRSGSLAASCRLPEPAKVDLAAEEAAIRQLTKDWFAAEHRHDLEASLSFLAPDAVFQNEGLPTFGGLPAARAAYTNAFNTPGPDARMEPRTVVVSESGDMAYDIGAFTVTVSGPGKSTEMRGKSTIVWRKRDGQWKVVVCAYSSDGPPASPAKN